MVNLLLLLAAGYLGLLLYLYASQTGLLYLPHYPGGASDMTPADAGLEYEAVTPVTTDGLKLAAWFVPAADARGTILFCHGNAGTISARIGTLRLFHELGFSTLIFDYRGYGGSQGKPSEEGTYRDAEAAWEFLLARGHTTDRIVLFGRSLGGAVAAELASRRRPAVLVLESTFTSLPDLAAGLYPLFPARWLSRYSYDTLARLPSIDVPLLVVHAHDDEIIPFSHGQRLYEAASPPKQLHALRGGHNDAIAVSASDYRRGLDAFFSRHLPPR